MVQAVIRNISKAYNQVKVVNDLNLDIYMGEILAIVGPSGCGKTTLLQIIAGLTQADTGTVTLAGKTMSSVAERIFVNPEKRGIAMVFQDYALWPHYNVFQNVSYPLKVRGTDRKQWGKVVEKVLKMVHLEGMVKRYPHELSGGEQQRVALARALAMDPELLLLDESLSNLDAQLKEEMQAEIKKIQKEMKLTIVHVTHDQHEAMGLADRLAVMNRGKLEQVGPVQEVYDYPATEFTASFIGKSNLVYKQGGNGKQTRLWDIARRALNSKYPASEAKILSVRPQDICLNDNYTEGGCNATARITGMVYRGNYIDYELVTGGCILTARTSARELYEIGQKIGFSISRATAIIPGN